MPIPTPHEHESCCQADPAAEQSLVKSLPERHLIRILMSEHEAIRINLTELESLATELAVEGGCTPERLSRVYELGLALVAAEPHHRREEEVLFVEMNARGVTGPPAVMLEEHERIRTLKHFIAAEAGRLTKELGDVGELVAKAGELVSTLRGHINKENGILYPMSLGIIRETEVWDTMLKQSDEIGYCCVGHRD